LALFRDRLLAHHFGAGGTLDIYYAAFRIPDFIFIFAASVVSTSVLIPFLVDKINKNTNKGKTFINDIFSLFLIFIVLVSGIIFFFVPIINRLILPGLSDSVIAEVSSLTRILLLSPIFLGLSSLFASVTQVHKRFLVYALSPLLYNLGIISGIIWFYPLFGIRGLVFGVVFGAMMHFTVQIPSVIKIGFLPKFIFNINWQEVKGVVYLSLPRALTLASSQVTLIFLIAFASLMTEGSISIFNFSLNLQSIPLAIIGVSYSVAAFPTLSRLFTDGKEEKFTEQIVVAARHIIFWSVPAIVLFIILRAQIVRVVLGSGEFDWSDTRLTAAALALFVFSVTAQSLILLFVRGYYAIGNTRKPLLINIFSSLVTIGLVYGLYKLFINVDVFRYFLENLLRVSDIEGTDILILPLGYSLGSMLNMCLLWLMFKQNFRQFTMHIFRTSLHIFSASVIMGFVTYQFLVIFASIFDTSTFWGVLNQGFWSGIIGIMSGVIILKVLKNKEIIEIQKALSHKFWKTETIIPGQRKL
jgi:putative peptidoglycan lipid II flippase